MAIREHRPFATPKSKKAKKEGKNNPEGKNLRASH